MTNNIGKVAQIIGAVVDVSFDNTETGLPNIYDALEIKRREISKTIANPKVETDDTDV